jgi:hypothetical protein
MESRKNGTLASLNPVILYEASVRSPATRVIVILASFFARSAFKITFQPDILRPEFWIIDSIEVTHGNYQFERMESSFFMAGELQIDNRYSIVDEMILHVA